MRFRVARDQQSVFQSELDSIAKNLKLNITAHISGIDAATGGASGTSTRRQRKQADNSGEKDKQTEKIRAEQIALREYKKTYGEVIQLQKTAAKLDANDPQQKYIRRKLGNLITYGKKQEAIINASQSASLKAEKAATDEANALKAKNSLLDAAQQKVKSYAAELARLSAKIPAQTGSKYGDVTSTLKSYATEQTQLGNFENASVAEEQVKRLELAYKSMQDAAKSAIDEINKPMATRTQFHRRSNCCRVSLIPVWKTRVLSVSKQLWRMRSLLRHPSPGRWRPLRKTAILTNLLRQISPIFLQHFRN